MRQNEVQTRVDDLLMHVILANDSLGLYIFPLLNGVSVGFK